MQHYFFLLIVVLIAASGGYSHSAQGAPMNGDAGTKKRTIGILIFDGVLANEVLAPLDVFAKPDSTGNSLFNVVLIAKSKSICVTEEGLKLTPDYSIENGPRLDVLVVPSSNNPDRQIRDKELVDYIRKENETAEYVASHCAGAFLLGESGIAVKKKVVTYCGGSEKLKRMYPKLIVIDDMDAAVVQDGKFISSNGNLVTYIASLELLEKMTSLAHRRYVEGQLLLHKLKQ